MKQKSKSITFQKMAPYSICITGATGFIGSKLVKRFTNSGYKIKAISRKPIKNTTNVKYMQADVFDVGKLTEVLQGVKIAYYLLHSMEGSAKNWKDFANRERIQAQNFLKAANNANVKRIIYLGGLTKTEGVLSPHMKSRKRVGKILSSGNIPVTELQASIILGKGGGSFTMLRYLVERLRVMVCPKWVKSLTQPIAADDVVEYLFCCIKEPSTVGKIFEIGGTEKVTYEELMKIYSDYLHKNLFVVQIPFLTTRLSSYWVNLVTPVKSSLARPLIDSLVHDSIVSNNSIKDIIDFPLKSIRESIEIAHSGS